MPEESSLKRSRSPEPESQHSNKRQIISGSSREGAHEGKAYTSTSAPVKNDSSTIDSKMNDTNSKSKPTQATGKDALPAPVQSAQSAAPPVPSQQIHLRCLIVTQDASIIIGKAGSHVNEIREKSGARVMVSESIPGNPERILNVSGPLDAVSKVSSS